MTKPFEVHGVEAEKAEAMRRYNNQKRFRNIVRASGVAFLCYLWFPTVAVSLQAAGGWLYRTGAVTLTNRTFVFVFANVLVALIFLLSRDSDDEESSASVRSSAESDLYDQYTSSSSSSTVTVTVSASDEKKVVDDGESKKQIVPAFIAEVDEEVVADKQLVPAFVHEEVVVEAVRKEPKGSCKRKKKVVRSAMELRRTESERKKEVKRPTAEFRRTESANSAIERLNSEEFRLTIEAFIMKRKKCIVEEANDVVASQEDCSSSRLELVGADSGYGLLLT